jgi:glycosyltransferase involved in cell wall biosynthesis
MSARHRVAVNLLWCVPGRVGGSEEYLVRQLLGLRAIGAPFDLTAFVPRGFAAAHPELATDMCIVEAPTSGRSRSLRVLVENSWLARRTRSYDIVHHGGGTLPARGNTTTVLTVHDVQYLTYPEYFTPLKLRYLRNRVPASVARATVVAVPSRYVGESLVAAYGLTPSSVHVVRHGMEPDIGRNATSADELRKRFDLGSSRVLVFPAVTHPHKNHEFILELLAHEWHDEDVVVVMAGGEGLAEERVMARARELGVTAKVRRIGRVDAHDRDGLIMMAEALVFPSKYEGFGAPVVEAMALGTPVVSGNDTALAEVVADAGLALPLTRDAWAPALTRVRDRREELIRLGRERAARYTNRESARDLCVVYDAALGRGPT